MSLLSLLAGCFGRSAADRPTRAPAEYPRFPATDVAGVAFRPVALDPGFSVRSFFLAPDKQRLYVLGDRRAGGDPPDRPRLRLFALDVTGTITHRLDLKPTDGGWGASLGMVGDELLLYAGDHFVVLDPASLTARERIPVWHEEHFPTAADIELMTPDEQRAAYVPLMDAALAHCPTCRWLEWPSGKYFVFVTGATGRARGTSVGRRAAWSPLTYEDAVIAPLKQRFAPLAVATNPRVSSDAGGDHLTVVDGAVQLREEDVLSGGTELDYPNYKPRVVVQYALTVGGRVLHFSTTDRQRHDRRVGLADNAYLTTADGAAWVRYMGRLYRIE